MNRSLIGMLAVLLAVMTVLSGCQNTAEGRKEYRYYDEILNVLWQGDKPNEEFAKQCDSLMILTYDNDGKVTELDNYWHLNDLDPQNDMHLHHLNSYEDGILKTSRVYSYLFDGSLYQLIENQYLPDGRIIRYSEYSVDGSETLLSDELFEYDEEGKRIRSAFYAADGTLLSDQSWSTDENGNEVYVSTSYRDDGTAEYIYRSVRDQEGNIISEETIDSSNP